MKNLVIIITALLIFGCGDNRDRITPTIDKEGQKLELKVTTYKSEDELNKYVKNPHKGLQGQAMYSPNHNICDIKLQKPRAIKVDDEFALTLGHELMHCLYGDYHK